MKIIILVAALMLSACVAVTVECTAYNGKPDGGEVGYAKSKVNAGYGEASAVAAVDKDGASTATATRSANTVETLVGAVIGAASGIMMGGGW